MTSWDLLPEARFSLAGRYNEPADTPFFEGDFSSTYDQDYMGWPQSPDPSSAQHAEAITRQQSQSSTSSLPSLSPETPPNFFFAPSSVSSPCEQYTSQHDEEVQTPPRTPRNFIYSTGDSITWKLPGTIANSTTVAGGGFTYRGEDPERMAGSQPSSYQPSSGSASMSRSTSQEDQDGGFCCLAEGCGASVFRRNADLDRHYKQRHLPRELREHFLCDYPRCPRSSEQAPFFRRDHYRDHLREFHKEDLCKRGSGKTPDGCNIDKDWWRCTRCLKRVYIEAHNFECPVCSTTCDEARRRRRKAHFRSDR